MGKRKLKIVLVFEVTVHGEARLGMPEQRNRLLAARSFSKLPL
jgi:hypothetical protein